MSIDYVALAIAATSALCGALIAWAAIESRKN
jgi:hypothetical protein